MPEAMRCPKCGSFAIQAIEPHIAHARGIRGALECRSCGGEILPDAKPTPEPDAGLAEAIDAGYVRLARRLRG